MNPAYEVLGFASGILGLSVALPQLYRVLKAKNHEGVSPTTWIIMLSNFTLWAAYALRYDSISQLVTNIVAAIFTILLVYVLLKQARNALIATIATFTTVTVFFVAGYYTPTWVMTTLLFSMVLLGRIPQIVASWKHYKNNKQTVVSKTTYSLMVGSSVGWISYGILTGLWHNIVASSLTLVSSFIILFLETRNSKTREQVSEQEPP